MPLKHIKVQVLITIIMHNEILIIAIIIFYGFTYF